MVWLFLTMAAVPFINGTIRAGWIPTSEEVSVWIIFGRVATITAAVNAVVTVSLLAREYEDLLQGRQNFLNMLKGFGEYLNGNGRQIS